MKHARWLVLLALVPCIALAAGWSLTRSYGTHTTEAACKAAAASQAAGTYLCTNVLQSSVTVPVVVPPPVTGTWQLLVAEGATFTISGTKTVRYGAGTAYVQRSMTGAGTCDNEFFGRDPATGVPKHCDVWTGTTAPPPPVSSVRDATIRWAVPTTNADGTPLVDLAGFRVRYGVTPGAPTDSVDVPFPTATSATLVTIPQARTYFTVRAYDTGGNESAPSIEVSK